MLFTVRLVIRLVIRAVEALRLVDSTCCSPLKLDVTVVAVIERE